MKQQMGLTPQMQQSLNVLQAATTDLRQMVVQEVAQNPVLEMETPETSLEEAGLDRDLDDTGSSDDGFDEEFAKLSQMDDEWREYMSQSRTKGPRTLEDEERRQFLLDSITAPVTLTQHLENQLAVENLTDEERANAVKLIGYLDDRGYLSQKLSEIVHEEGVPLDQLQRAQFVIQNLDPPGLAAENLRDCLIAQLRRLRKTDTLEYTIVSEHLDELARRKWPDIARKLKIPVEKVAEVAASIGELNPRPGQDFASSPTAIQVQPDIFVERTEDKWVVRMNNDTLPRLRISNAYKDMMTRSQTGQDVRGYIRERIRSGKFFIQCIDQRQQTIRRIAEEIVRRQAEFLEHGPSHLKPMNMAQMAEVVGVHETTVSRAVAGKYVSTPQGVFELRYFFTTGLASESGEALSNVSIKTALQELIKTENPSKPWSDEAIVKKLSEQGIKLARRTVAKYRDELGILPSHLRKTY